MTGRAWMTWPFAAPYIALWERNIPVAIVAPDSDLSQYELVFAPFLNLLRPEVVENLRRFVHRGGTLVLGPRTGFKDEFNRIFPTPQPGPLAELSGATVRYFDSLEPERTNSLLWAYRPDKRGTEIGLWAEVLDANGAEVLATYQHGWYAGEAAITSHRSGFAGERSGQTIYVGAMGGPALYHRLLDWLQPQLELQAVLAAPAGVEVCERVAKDGRRVVFVLNHTAQEYSLSLPAPIIDLLTGQTHTRSLGLAPGQVVIYEVREARGEGHDAL
jgi:beta-galactosidase